MRIVSSALCFALLAAGSGCAVGSELGEKGQEPDPSNDVMRLDGESAPAAAAGYARGPRIAFAAADEAPAASPDLTFTAYNNTPGMALVVNCGSQHRTFAPSSKMQTGSCTYQNDHGKPVALTFMVQSFAGEVFWEDTQWIDPVTGLPLKGSMTDAFSAQSKVGKLSISSGFFAGGAHEPSALRKSSAYVYMGGAHDHWMGKLTAQHPEVLQLPLSSWVLPGSHDSAMFTSPVEASPDATSVAFKNVHLTQRDTIADQLALGARYLEFRPVFAGPDKVHHQADASALGAALGQSWASFAREVADFLVQNPSELVVLRLKRDVADGLQGVGHGELEASLLEIIAASESGSHADQSPLKFGHMELAQQSLGMLRKSGQRLVIAWDGEKDSLTSTYSPAVYQNPGWIQSHINGYANQADVYPAVAYQAGANLALSADVIRASAARPSAASPLALATKAAADVALNPWVRSLPRSTEQHRIGLQVVSQNFYDLALTESAIARMTPTK
jgi:hypothetical protein